VDGNAFPPRDELQNNEILLTAHEKQRERERQRETERQTDRQADR